MSSSRTQQNSSGYKNILVAVDFSVVSESVIQKAKQLALQSSSQLELIYIVELPTYPVLEDVAVMGMPGLWDEEAAKTLFNASLKKLQALAEKYDIQHSHVIEGVAEVEIIKHAESHNKDLIVLGSHGLSGLRSLLGSTTNSVINHAHCDVLAVRMQAN